MSSKNDQEEKDMVKAFTKLFNSSKTTGIQHCETVIMLARICTYLLNKYPEAAEKWNTFLGSNKHFSCEDAENWIMVADDIMDTLPEETMIGDELDMLDTLEYLISSISKKRR